MIKVDRSSVPVPVALLGPNCLGAKERLRNKGKVPKAMNFSAFKDPSVKEALKKLFYGKCAYCESLMVAQQPGDVEHFRPKAEVWVTNPRTGGIRKIPGYYWLAAEWENLLPACADCNRIREHEIVGLGKIVTGKGNYFPLSNERTRAKSPKRVALEARLLLDPCTDSPEKHLSFQANGTIKARRRGGHLSAMGCATIETCALMREGLIQAKAATNVYLEDFITLALEDLHSGRDIHPTVVHGLEEMMNSKSQYSVHVRQYVARKLNPHWRKVKQRLPPR